MLSTLYVNIYKDRLYQFLSMFNKKLYTWNTYFRKLYFIRNFSVTPFIDLRGLRSLTFLPTVQFSTMSHVNLFLIPYKTQMLKIFTTYNLISVLCRNFFFIF